MKLKTLILCFVLFGLADICHAETYYRMSEKDYNKYSKYGWYSANVIMSKMERCDTKDIDLDMAGKIVAEYIKRDEERKERFAEAAKYAAEHWNDKEMSIEKRLDLIDVKIKEIFENQGIMEKQIQMRQMKKIK